MEDAPPPTKHESMKSAKARLMVQRAEDTAPKLRSNPTTPSSVEPASIDDVDMSRPKFNAPSDPSSAAAPAEADDAGSIGAHARVGGRAPGAAGGRALHAVGRGPGLAHGRRVAQPAAPNSTTPAATAPAVDPELATRLKTIDGFLEADDIFARPPRTLDDLLEQARLAQRHSAADREDGQRDLL